jgi:hypothetical protein
LPPVPPWTTVSPCFAFSSSSFRFCCWDAIFLSFSNLDWLIMVCSVTFLISTQIYVNCVFINRWTY